MSRLRLRFVRQELDLAAGATFIGRDADCDVTLDDALVSRRHARIDVEGDAATIHDLGSRNGIVVNGRRVSQSATLAIGDRIRIATHEMVLCDGSRRAVARPTGKHLVCESCSCVFAAEAGACPSCGASTPS